MTKKKYKPIKTIRRSCITGKAVWVTHCTTYHGILTAYKKACEHEIERTKNLAEMAARLKGSILKLLNDCLEGLPIDQPLTPEQQAAARQLLALAEYNPYTPSEFYYHIMEERRRKAEDKEILRQMREREKAGKAAKETK